MRINDKEVSTSGWFGFEHHKEIHTIDYFRHFGMETLCKLYPKLFPPEIWLSENPLYYGCKVKKIPPHSNYEVRGLGLVFFCIKFLL